MLLCADNDKDYGVDLLSAIHILTHAWEQPNESTVQNCFRHVTFSSQGVQSNLPEDEDEDTTSGEVDADFIKLSLVLSSQDKTMSLLIKMSWPAKKRHWRS